MLAVQSIQLDGLLSFPPGAPAFELRPLYVLIGPNGAGKSNFVDAFDLLAVTPLDVAAFVLIGGGLEECPRKEPDGSSRTHASELPHQAGTK